MPTSEAIVHKAFRNFSKWETYGIVFELMNKRLITLKRIAEIASEYDIKESVIHSRRRYFLQLL